MLSTVLVFVFVICGLAILTVLFIITMTKCDGCNDINCKACHPKGKEADPEQPEKAEKIREASIEMHAKETTRCQAMYPHGFRTKLCGEDVTVFESEVHICGATGQTSCIDIDRLKAVYRIGLIRWNSDGKLITEHIRDSGNDIHKILPPAIAPGTEFGRDPVEEENQLFDGVNPI